MTPFVIDFNPSPPWRQRCLRSVNIALGVLAIWGAWSIFHTNSGLDALNSAETTSSTQIEILQGKLRTAQVKPPYYAEALKVTQISEFPLEDALAALERNDTEGAQLIEVILSPSEGFAHAVVEMPSAVALQSYLEHFDNAVEQGTWVLEAVHGDTRALSGTRSAGGRQALGTPSNAAPLRTNVASGGIDPLSVPNQATSPPPPPPASLNATTVNADLVWRKLTYSGL